MHSCKKSWKELAIKLMYINTNNVNANWEIKTNDGIGLTDCRIPLLLIPTKVAVVPLSSSQYSTNGCGEKIMII